MYRNLIQNTRILKWENPEAKACRYFNSLLNATIVKSYATIVEFVSAVVKLVTIKTKFIGNIVMWCALFWRPVQMILNWWIGNTVQISLRVACENCITFGNWQEAQTIINSARPSEVSAILVAILAMVARATIVRSPGALHRKAIYKTVPFARRREWL